MLIWHRWGILVLVLFVVAYLATQLGVDAVWGEGFYTSHEWPKLVAGLLATVAIGAVGWQLNRKEKAWATTHRFFFVPMQYWAPVVLVVTAWSFFTAGA